MFKEVSGAAVLLEDGFLPLSKFEDISDIPSDDWWIVESNRNDPCRVDDCNHYTVDSLVRAFLHEAKSSESVHHTVLANGHTEVVDRCLKIFLTGYPGHLVEPE